jgi:hypothetical protein
MDHLLERIQTLEQHVQTLTQQTTSVARRLRWWRRLACSLAVLTMLSLPVSVGGAKDDDDKVIKGLAQRVRALERKLQHLTMEVGADNFLPELVITGANLRIVNGLGATDTVNGLGNLIVGYNELRGSGSIDDRTGSHNMVGGILNNFSSFGGLVVGAGNEISGMFASVSGGALNTASGLWSSVSGGSENTASDNNSSVSGGNRNTASNQWSSVSGGIVNTASGVGSSVSGGAGNRAGGPPGAPLGAGPFSSVSGGGSNTASGIMSSVCGGGANTASDSVASISGGLFNTASGTFSSVSGGADNTAGGDHSSVSGGINRSAPGLNHWAAGHFFADD